jgi:hypothetical protein
MKALMNAINMKVQSYLPYGSVFLKRKPNHSKTVNNKLGLNSTSGT